MSRAVYRDHNGGCQEFSPWRMALRALRALRASGRYTDFTLRTQVHLSYKGHTPACLTFHKSDGGLVEVFYRLEKEEWNACVWRRRRDGSVESDQHTSFYAGDFDLAEALSHAGLI